MVVPNAKQAVTLAKPYNFGLTTLVQHWFDTQSTLSHDAGSYACDPLIAGREAVKYDD